MVSNFTLSYKSLRVYKSSVEDVLNNLAVLMIHPLFKH
jgi:hypothetical protein